MSTRTLTIWTATAVAAAVLLSSRRHNRHGHLVQPAPAGHRPDRGRRSRRR